MGQGPVPQGGDQHKPDQPQASKHPGASSKIDQFGSAAVGFDPAVKSGHSTIMLLLRSRAGQIRQIPERLEQTLNIP